MVRLAGIFDLLEPLRDVVRRGLPVYGSCAGMILLADRLAGADHEQPTIGGMDVVVRRNAFGRQVDSFEADLEVDLPGGPLHAVFIRAPWIESAGPSVDVLARLPEDPGLGPAAGRIVLARQGRMLASSFHPELTRDDRIHRWFVDAVRSAQ
jgi:5'-phosphate synthase pdxT subunit